MKKFEVDWKVLDALLQFKVTQEYCANYLGCSVDTLQRACLREKGMYLHDYHNFKIGTTAVKLQQRAVEAALKGDTRMLVFALKNIAGWTEKEQTRSEGLSTLEALVAKSMLQESPEKMKNIDFQEEKLVGSEVPMVKLADMDGQFESEPVDIQTLDLRNLPLKVRRDDDEF